MEAEQLRAIEAECQRLRNRYCRGIDTYDVEAVLSVFTDDGIWDRPPGQGVLQGKAAIVFRPA